MPLPTPILPRPALSSRVRQLRQRVGARGKYPLQREFVLAQQVADGRLDQRCQKRGNAGVTRPRMRSNSTADCAK